jgi:ATP-dependent RNA helicase DHX57
MLHPDEHGPLLRVTFSHTSQAKKYRVLVAHSSVSLEDQAHIYERTSKGTRKIVISTNICETSVTGIHFQYSFLLLLPSVLTPATAVPDVTAVIDSGRAKVVQFNPSRALREFHDVFADTSSLRQRQGRAGRVREGICFKLYSSCAYSTFPSHAVPELRRCPLSGLMLQMFAPRNTRISPALFLTSIIRCDTQSRNINASIETLRSTLDPPPEHTIASALQELQSLGALREDDGAPRVCELDFAASSLTHALRLPHGHWRCFMRCSC